MLIVSNGFGLKWSVPRCEVEAGDYEGRSLLRPPLAKEEEIVKDGLIALWLLIRLPSFVACARIQPLRLPSNQPVLPRP